MYVRDGKFVKLSYLQNYPINFRMTEPAGDRIYIEYNTTRYELSMLASPIYTVLKCSCFFYQALFHG